MSDLWEYLKNTDRPIVMYGTGDGGDKIFAELDRLGIKVSGVFASDGFVRSREFHGYRVISYSDAKKQFGDGMIILLAFGSSLPDVMERFFALDSIHELYAPDVPVAGGEIFNAAFYEKNRESIELARSLLADGLSVRVFDSVINYRLSGKIKYLAENLTLPEDSYESLLHTARYRLAVDLGAYTGDTALEIIDHSPNLTTVVALEPDEKNFAKLCINVSSEKKIEPHLAAAWDKRDVLLFRKGGGRGIRKAAKEKTVEVRAVPVDLLLEDRIPDFIKFDVEGAEREAINGCMNCITKYSPELQIALYHKSADIFALPIMINKLNPGYKLYMRRYPYVPAWDLNLFAVRE